MFILNKNFVHMYSSKYKMIMISLLHPVMSFGKHEVMIAPPSVNLNRVRSITCSYVKQQPVSCV